MRRIHKKLVESYLMGYGHAWSFDGLSVITLIKDPKAQERINVMYLLGAMERFRNEHPEYPLGPYMMKHGSEVITYASRMLG